MIADIGMVVAVYAFVRLGIIGGIISNRRIQTAVCVLAMIMIALCGTDLVTIASQTTRNLP